LLAIHHHPFLLFFRSLAEKRLFCRHVISHARPAGKTLISWSISPNVEIRSRDCLLNTGIIAINTEVLQHPSKPEPFLEPCSCDFSERSRAKKAAPSANPSHEAGIYLTDFLMSVG